MDVLKNIFSGDGLIATGIGGFVLLCQNHDATAQLLHAIPGMDIVCAFAAPVALLFAKFK